MHADPLREGGVNSLASFLSLSLSLSLTHTHTRTHTHPRSLTLDCKPSAVLCFYYFLLEYAFCPLALYHGASGERPALTSTFRVGLVASSLLTFRILDTNGDDVASPSPSCPPAPPPPPPPHQHSLHEADSVIAASHECIEPPRSHWGKEGTYRISTAALTCQNTRTHHTHTYTFTHARPHAHPSARTTGQNPLSYTLRHRRERSCCRVFPVSPCRKIRPGVQIGAHQHQIYPPLSTHSRLSRSLLCLLAVINNAFIPLRIPYFDPVLTAGRLRPI